MARLAAALARLGKWLTAPPPRSSSGCPYGLSTNRTHPYCPCRLHQSSVRYRDPQGQGLGVDYPFRP